MIEEDTSSSSHYELIQANTALRSERIIDNEMEERKNEHFELLEDPILYPVPLEMEYKPKYPFLQHLEEPIEKVGVQLNIFHATQPPLSKNECFFLEILKQFVEDSLPDSLTKGCFALPFIDQTIG
jgi:hypothetical protein